MIKKRNPMSHVSAILYAALACWPISLSAQQIPTPTIPPTTSPSTRLPHLEELPNVDWGNLNDYFVISKPKIEPQKRTLPYDTRQYETYALTFIAELRNNMNFLVPIYMGYCYDADNIVVWSAILTFSPILSSMLNKPGDRTRAWIDIPSEVISNCKTIKFSDQVRGNM